MTMQPSGEALSRPYCTTSRCHPLLIQPVVSGSQCWCYCPRRASADIRRAARPPSLAFSFWVHPPELVVFAVLVILSHIFDASAGPLCSGLQMAGRAGRRGLDTVGTVVIACWDDLPEEVEIKKMLTGRWLLRGAGCL